MFTKLVVFFLTLLGVLIVDEAGILIGVTLSSTLIYVSTKKYIQTYSDYHISTSINVFDVHLASICETFLRIITSCKWRLWASNVKKIIYLMKVLTSDNDVTQNESTINFALPVKNSRLCQSKIICTDEEIKTIVNCILREHVKVWYHSKISGDDEFVSNVDCVIYNTLINFCNSISKADKEKFLCHILKVYIHFYFHFQASLDTIGKNAEVLQICLLKHEELLKSFQMHHWAMKDSLTEWTYLKSVIGVLVDSFGPKELLSCPILHTVVVEILTQNVMFNVINIVTDPGHLNLWLAKLLQNLSMFKNDSFLVNNFVTVSYNEFQISNIACESSIQSQVSPIILLPQDTDIDESDVLLKSDLSDFDSISNVSISDISVDRVSNKSSENSICNIQQGVSSRRSFSEDNNITKSSRFLFPRLSVRAHSNVNIHNKSGNLFDKTFSSGSNSLQVVPIKRSHSADYIQYASHKHNLSPLNLSSRSIRYCEKTRKSYLTIKAENFSHGNVEVAEEAIEREVPPLISEIQIVHTQQQEDSGQNPYTLYCIQYEGIFENISSDSHYPDLIQHTVSTKRRFREFLALQSRLEDDPLIKVYLKDIKGPSKWLVTPFANLDKKNIAERRLFLETYLLELCKHDIIIKSQVFLQFLAYGGDANIAFVKKNMDLNVPRIDKFIAKSVKGAIDLLRTALPSSDSSIPKESSQFLPEVLTDDSNRETDFQVYLSKYMKKAPDIIKSIDKYLKHFDVHPPCQNLHKKHPTSTDKKGVSRKKTQIFPNSSIVNQHGCACSLNNSTFGMKKDMPVQLLLDIISESFPKTPCISNLLNFFPTSIVQSLLEERFDELNKEYSAVVLHLFHNSVWPDEKNLPKVQWNPEMTIMFQKTLVQNFEEFLSKKKFGQALIGVLGSKNISHATELLLGSIQNGELNKCFLYYAFDVVIATLCPEE